MRYTMWVLILGVVGVLFSARAWTQDSAKDADAAAQAEMVKVLDSEPERVFKLADNVQANPYGPRAMAIISVLTRYGMASTKVTLSIGSLIQPFSTPAHRDADLRLFGEYWTGLTVYAVEHDGKAGDTDASNLYAVKFLLKSYRLMLKARPTSHSVYGDELARLDQSGKLSAFIHQRVVADRAHPVKVTVGTPTPTPSSATASPVPSPSASPDDMSPPVVAPPPQSTESPDPSQTPSGASTGQL